MKAPGVRLWRAIVVSDVDVMAPPWTENVGGAHTAGDAVATALEGEGAVVTALDGGALYVDVVDARGLATTDGDSTTGQSP